MRGRDVAVLGAVLTCVVLPGQGVRAQAVLQVPTDDYPTIQQALDAAVDGDTVLVGRGAYSEDFTLVTGVAVQGEETAETFLTGAVDAVDGGGGTIERFTVRRTSWTFLRADGLVIRNCVFTGAPANGIAITIENSENTEVSNNVFHANDVGLKMANELGFTLSSGSVLGNVFTSHTDIALLAPMDLVIKTRNLFAANAADGDTGDSPVFGVPGFVDVAAEDFHLMADSGCVDAVPADALADPDGSPADCGAYGGPGQDPNPRRVTNLVGTSGTTNDSADLTWTADDNYLVTGYLLYYGTASGVYDGTGAAEGNSPVSVAGRDTTTATLSKLTGSSTPPPAPGGLAAGPGDGSIFLSWDAAPGATGYTVLYGTESGVYTEELDAGKSTAVSVGGLSNGVTYYLAVRPHAATTYYFAVAATGTPAQGSTVPPEGQTSAEWTLPFDQAEGNPSAEVSETPGTISGYPDLDDSGFCFLRALPPLPAALGGSPAAGPLGALLLALAIATRRCRQLLPMALLGLALATAAGTARAAYPRWSLDARAGAFWPSEGDWSDNYDHSTLPEVKVGVGYRLTSLLELGVEAGYRHAEGSVRSTDGGSPLAEPLDQTLTVVPLQAYALVRLWASEQQLLVPYLAAGLSSYLYQHEVDGDRSAQGRQDGFHARAGLHMSLHRFDPHRADRSRQQYGLLGSGLTLEAQYAQADDFGSSDTDLGGWSLFAGLNLQF